MRDHLTLIRESVFQKHVREYAGLMGWGFMHISDSRRSFSRGFPDNVFAKRGRVVFAELKTMTGVVSPEQREWAEILKEGPAEYYLWRPDSWEDIERVLGPLDERT